MQVSSNSLYSIRGFTLIELLVVLVLMGFVAGIVLPSIDRFYNSVLESQQRSDLISQINDVGYQVYLSGQNYALDEHAFTEENDQKLIIELASDWRVLVKKPVEFNFDGYCMGGELLITTPQGVSEKWQLNEPRCQVTIDDQSGVQVETTDSQ